MGKPAATDRPCLRSLSHSFTLDFVVLWNGTKAEAHTTKQEIGEFLCTMGLTLSEEKTKVTRRCLKDVDVLPSMRVSGAKYPQCDRVAS